MLGAAAASEALTLNEKFIVVVPARSTLTETTAASEFLEHFRKITGVRLQCRSEKEAEVTGRRILIGQSAEAEKLLPGIKFSGLKADEIIIKTAGDDLILAGGRPRGTLYAVYIFLEDYAGVRWWTSTESFIPKKPALQIGDLNIRYAPPFIYREAYYYDVNRNPQFAVRLKNNGHAQNIPENLGGHLQIIGWCHTFYQLLPPEKYFAAHPEWYSEINGKRISHNAQLCLSNPAMRAELTKNVLERIAKNPQAGLISISQNDCRNYCTCPKCKALDDAEGSPAASVIDCVNAVAAEVEKRYPGVLVETLAYSYTQSPPKNLKPRSNVLIRLCSIKCDFLQPLTAPVNVEFQCDVIGWGKIASQLYIWDYVTNFSNYLLPHPNLQVLGPNLRYFADHKVIGVFEQGDSYTTIGDFLRLRAWVISHLLWNPHADAEALTKEFLYGYYGAAAPHLQQYLTIIRQAAEKNGANIGCYYQRCFWLSKQDEAVALQCFTRAAAAVKNSPVLSERIRRERLPLLVAILENRIADHLKAGMAGRSSPGCPDSSCLAAEVINLSVKYHNNWFREGCNFQVYKQRLISAFENSETTLPPASIDVSPWMVMFELGKNGNYVSDPAVKGRIVMKIVKAGPWAVQCHFPSDLLQNNESWHCYAELRADGQSAGGAAKIGFYDMKNKKLPIERTLSGKEIVGTQYRTVDLGRHRLTAGMYCWMALEPQAQALYINRLWLIKE